MIKNNKKFEEILSKIISASKNNKVYILGHMKPDADSVFSSYLLSNILKSMNIDSEFSILENDYEYCDSDKKLINAYLKEKPVIVKDIKDKKFILVDHNNLFNLNKENVIGAIDHHRITGEVDNLIEMEYASTALLIYDLFKDRYEFNDKEKELIYLSVLTDTNYLCSSRFKDEDKELLDELNIDVDVDKLQKEYFSITNFDNNIKDNLNSDYKEYNFDNKNIKRTLIYGYKEHYNKYYDIYLDYIKNEKDYLIIWCDFETKKTYIHINSNSIELDYILTSTFLILDMLKEKGLLV